MGEKRGARNIRCGVGGGGGGEGGGSRHNLAGVLVHDIVLNTGTPSSAIAQVMSTQQV